MTILAALLLSAVQPPIAIQVHDASGHTHTVVGTYSAFEFGANGAITLTMYIDTLFCSSFGG